MIANGTRMQMCGLHNVHIQPPPLALCQQEGTERQKKTQIFWQKLTGARTGAPTILKQVTYFGILFLLLRKKAQSQKSQSNSVVK